MSRFARRIHIGASPAAVWSKLVDVEGWPAWASQFTSLTLLDPGPLTMGTRVRVRPKGMTAATWRVTEYEEGRSFTWEASPAPGLRLAGGHVVTPEGDGAGAEFWLDASGPLGAVLGSVLRRTVFSRNTRSATEGLRRALEGGSPA